MMTGQPYKSPETVAPAAGENGQAQQTDGMPSTVSSSAAAVRGVSTVSARLQRQRLANQLYKDAWMTIDPTLKGSITPAELLDKVAPLAGLDITDADLQEMVDPSVNGDGRITCEFGPWVLPLPGGYGQLTRLKYQTDIQFLEFSKRQEVNDIVSGYGE